ncbi:hypothetical protein ACOXXX_00700 [Thalassococcus sp. BH17M4-6]|uniref:hypothetical protein n=1 Tax=Thalassococcus sp. BH17M4-6 TaxID=3413148 RepID=UPI003BE7DCF9
MTGVTYRPVMAGPGKMPARPAAPENSGLTVSQTAPGRRQGAQTAPLAAPLGAPPQVAQTTLPPAVQGYAAARAAITGIAE